MWFGALKRRLRIELYYSINLQQLIMNPAAFILAVLSMCGPQKKRKKKKKSLREMFLFPLQAEVWS